MLHTKSILYILLLIIALDGVFILLQNTSRERIQKTHIEAETTTLNARRFTVLEQPVSQFEIKYNGKISSAHGTKLSKSSNKYTLIEDYINTNDANNFTYANSSRFVSRECEAVLYEDSNKIDQLKKANPVYLNQHDKPMKWADTKTDEDMALVANFKCSAFIAEYDFLLNDDVISDEERELPIAFTILMHENLHQTMSLLSATYRPHNVYCIHLDGKVNGTVRETLNTVSSCFPNVFIASKSIDIQYASVSRLLADIVCMKDMLQKEHKWKYLINLCGQDFPLRTNHEMVQQLKKLKGTNFIHGTNLTEALVKRTSHSYNLMSTIEEGKKQYKMVITDRVHSPPPFNMTVMKNLAYNFYTRDFLQWALYGKEGRALLDWSMDTYSPDEHFWLMLNTHPHAPGGSKKIYHFDLARVVIWKTSNNSICSGYWRHNICVFGSGDVSSIIRQNKYAFFANKFDTKTDSVATQCVRQWLDERVFVAERERDVRNPKRKPRIFY